jgi:uncharacterized protein YrrD
MYITFANIQGFSVKTWDQDIVGHIKSLYFDELTWTVRYILIETILFVDKKTAIIAPVAIDKIKPDERMVVLSLKKEHIEKSPDVDGVMPLSREKELELAERYEWPAYWEDLSASMPEVVEELAISKESPTADRTEMENNPIRDMAAILSYQVVAQDDSAGSAKDFIFDTDTWHVAFLIVNVSGLHGHDVMLPPTAIAKVDWQEKTVYTGTLADTVKKAPEFTKDTLEKLQA